MARQQSESFYVRGTGAAINVSLGYYPDKVEIYNLTDGDKIHHCHLMGGRMVMVFSSGDGEIQAGDTIKGATSLATGVVKDVILDTGSWAGGDAAGWLVLEFDTVVGTFASEAIFVLRSADGVVGDGADDATGAAIATFNQDIDTEVAAATGNAGVSHYAGVAGSAAKGITIGSTISEDAKLLVVHCFRNDVQKRVPNSA